IAHSHPDPGVAEVNSKISRHTSFSFAVESGTIATYFAKSMSSLPITKFGENLPVTGIVAFSQAAVGVGVGLLVADKLGHGARQKTAIALIGAGAAVVIPFALGLYNRISNRPSSSRRMRKQLDSIRDDTGFPDSSEII
ncbi:MAG: hypothetical protein ACOVMP_03495, partial [Chthoniobacterales bacterium]